MAIYRSSRSSINTDDRNDNDTSSSLEEHDQEQLERENDSSSLYLCGRVSQKLSLIPSSSMSSSKIRKLTEAAEQEKKTRTYVLGESKEEGDITPRDLYQFKFMHPMDPCCVSFSFILTFPTRLILLLIGWT